jgi:hypothetical protein
LALALLMVAAGAGAQQKTGEHDAILASGSPGTVLQAARASGPVLREIDDPWTGARWQLQRDEDHPGGPHRLLLVELGHAPVAGGAAAAPAKQPLVIHPGDPLTVEEHTAVVDASLEAVALGQATAGMWFEARLKIGGRVLRVLALGPGRAILQAEPGGRP